MNFEEKDPPAMSTFKWVRALRTSQAGLQGIGTGSWMPGAGSLDFGHAADVNAARWKQAATICFIIVLFPEYVSGRTWNY